jgi:tripartite-type tricarboxylate transporter receptor subunit TctC
MAAAARQIACVGAALLWGLTTAGAQTYPSRVITIVVPLPPGGATDTLTRTLADRMRTRLGQPIIVENVAGAGGTLGIARVTRAAPDGYTLGVGNWAGYVAAGATYPVPYDLLRDLEPIAKLADTPLWVVARMSLPVSDLSGLIAWLKANADKASAGIVDFGSGGHICGLSMQGATGTRYQFVPYRGGALAMQDLMAGHIDLMCDMAANSLPQVRAGTIKPIAVMSRRRWFAAPMSPRPRNRACPAWPSRSGTACGLPQALQKRLWRSSTRQWSMRSPIRPCRSGLPSRGKKSRRASSRHRKDLRRSIRRK